MDTNRIIEQAKEMNVFTDIISYNEHSIPDFFLNHKQFMEMTPGYGYWMWKPRIIQDALEKMNDGDILLYCDAGTYLNKKGIPRYNEYLTILQNPDIHILVFDLPPNYKANSFVKNDVVMMYYPDFQKKIHGYTYASPIFFKKTEATMNFVNDWKNLCENYHFIDKSPSIWFSDIPEYGGNDCDNGIFNVCLAKYNIAHHISPYETNVYFPNGVQKYNETDWSVLDEFPLQTRRIKPQSKWHITYSDEHLSA
jgi:hypothetical protein